MLRSRLLLLNSLLLLALLGNHWGRRIESASVTQKEIVRNLSLPFRDWKVTNSAVSKSDLAQLEPDDALVRLYQGPEHTEVEFTVIVGHRKRTVHTPTLCLNGGGWEVLSQRYMEIPVEGRKVHAVRQLMTREGKQAFMTYFFTDGDYTSPSLAQYQAVQLLKRLKASVPLGALVRMIVPITSSPAEADAISDDFALATLPTVLNTLHNTHLELH